MAFKQDKDRYSLPKRDIALCPPDLRTIGYATGSHRMGTVAIFVSFAGDSLSLLRTLNMLFISSRDLPLWVPYPRYRAPRGSFLET